MLKGLGCGKPKLKELADEFGAQAEYRALYQQAELGKRYQKELEDSIVRLGLSLELAWKRRCCGASPEPPRRKT